MRSKLFLGGAALAAAAFLGSRLVLAQDAERSRGAPVITVSASAEVSVQPDTAVVRLGVLAQAPEAADAQQRVNEAMQRILAAVTGLGIPERSVRTEDLSLSPVYGDQRPAPDREPQEPRIVGYRASNVVAVEVTELARIGEIIDAGIGAGANQLQGISFRLRDDVEARAEAIRQAVAAAAEQAAAIAGALGVRLGPVQEAVAGGYDIRPPAPYVGARFAVAEMAATPVQPGEVGVSASVTVTYRIADGAPRGARGREDG